MTCSSGRNVWAPALAVFLALAVSFAAEGRGKKERDEALVNVLLAPDLAKWLVGAVGEIASAEERRAYLTLVDDDEARAFIDEFWQRRKDPERPWPGEQPRDVFEVRAAEADRLYTEGLHLGRRTPRGVLHVLFGPPESQSYEREDGPLGATVEIWKYDRKEVVGLHGERPATEYAFSRRGDLTVRHQRRRDSRLLRRRGVDEPR